MDFLGSRKPETSMSMIFMAILTIAMAVFLSGYIFQWHSFFKSGFPGAECSRTSDCLDGLTCQSDGTCGC